MPRFTLRLVLVAILMALLPAGSLWAQLEHVLFISSTQHGIAPGAVNNPVGEDFGGQPAADSLCTEQAAAGGLLPGWNGVDRLSKALISTTTVDANERVDVIGRVVNTRGDVLANNEADLWDGTLASSVRYDEGANPIPFTPTGSLFWTGSNALGEVSQNANNWNSSSSGTFVKVGQAYATANWFSVGQFPANQSYRLPCLCEARVIDPGDYNDDRRVDAADYVVWRNTIGASVARGVGADGNGDGAVTQADYTVWRTNFGTNYVFGGEPGAAAEVQHAVPEPSAIMLIATGMFTAGQRRRDRSTFPRCNRRL